MLYNLYFKIYYFLYNLYICYNVFRNTYMRLKKHIFIACSVERVTDLSLLPPGHLSNKVLNSETVLPKPHGS